MLIHYEKAGAADHVIAENVYIDASYTLQHSDNYMPVRKVGWLFLNNTKIDYDVHFRSTKWGR